MLGRVIFVGFWVILAGCDAKRSSPPVVEAPVHVEKTPEPVVAAIAVEMNQVAVVSTKKETVENVHTMKVGADQLRFGEPGDLSTLQGHLTIHTDSWSSPVEVRDGRVKELFLNVTQAPTAQFHLESVDGLHALADGEEGQLNVGGTLELLGAKLPLQTKVDVTREGESYAFHVADPVTVTASGLGLASSLQAVSDACGVPLSDATKVVARFELGG